MPFLADNGTAFIRSLDVSPSRIAVSNSCIIFISNAPSNFPEVFAEFARFGEGGGLTAVLPQGRNFRIDAGPVGSLEFAIGNPPTLIAQPYNPAAVNISGGIATLATATIAALTSTSISAAFRRSTTPNGRVFDVTAAAATSLAATGLHLIATPAAAIAVTLGAGAADGERRRVVFGAATTCTWAATGATVSPLVKTSFAAGEAIELVFNLTVGTPANTAATTWYPA